MTTTPDIEGIERRANEATPGPWNIDSHALGIWCPSEKGGETKIFDIRGWGYFTGRGHGALALSAEEGKRRQTANGDFVAHARTDIPALLAEVKRLRAREEKLSRTIQEFGRCPRCGGQGWVEGVEPVCCGNITRSGSCCGNPVAGQCQEQCGECDGTGLTLPARAALSPEAQS
jgi:hypothetical protein